MKLRAAAFLACLFSATLAWAQFPSRPVTIIVPIPPGGAPDIAARVLADKLGQTLGQPVVVENRVGSNGVAPASNFNPANVAFDLDRVVDENGVVFKTEIKDGVEVPEDLAQSILTQPAIAEASE